MIYRNPTGRAAIDPEPWILVSVQCNVNRVRTHCQQQTWLYLDCGQGGLWVRWIVLTNII